MLDVRIRPVESQDLEAVYKLAVEAGYGMTNLPANKPLLADKIAKSISSFQKNANTPGDEIYFFVMETIDAHRIVGCAGIIALAGAEGPLYHYRISNEILSSDTLALCTTHPVLYVVNDYQNLTELGMLMLEKASRHHSEAELLSHFRLLYILQNQQRFTKKIFACMRGVIDEDGNAPFWTHVGEKFINMSFLEANRLIIKGQTPYLIELLPKTPMQVVTLPEAAQKVIGVSHHDTKPAVELLKREGFEFEKLIDVFDGGPTLELNVAHSYTAEHSQKAKVTGIVPQVTSKQYLIATTGPNFRACMGSLLIYPDNVVVTCAQVAKALEIKEGDTIMFVRTSA